MINITDFIKRETNLKNGNNSQSFTERELNILLYKALSEQLSIGGVIHWVAISDRLPNDYQRVIVARKGEANVMKILTYKKHFDNKHWGDSMESHFASPTHWMPLPEPPCV